MATEKKEVKYPDDCKERDAKNPIKCGVFDMSCAFFHTCMANRNNGRCPFYIKKEVTP